MVAGKFPQNLARGSAWLRSNFVKNMGFLFSRYLRIGNSLVLWEMGSSQVRTGEDRVGPPGS